MIGHWIYWLAFPVSMFAIAAFYFRASTSVEAETAIVAFLKTRGQRPIAIKPLRFSWKVKFGRGLSNMARGYKVTAASDDGSTNTYIYAYDPAGYTVHERNGLKRFFNGVWFDAT